MIFRFEQRPSDSSFVEMIWRTQSERAGMFTSLAVSHWEMVVMRYNGKMTLTVRGPETQATPVYYSIQAELKHFSGKTPAQIIGKSEPEQMSLLFKTAPLF